MMSLEHRKGYVCPKLGLSVPTCPQCCLRGQRLSLSSGVRAGPWYPALSTEPPERGPQASVLGLSLASLFPPGLGLACSPLTYEWIPGKGSGPPAVTMPASQTSTLSLGG